MAKSQRKEQEAFIAKSGQLVSEQGVGGGMVREKHFNVLFPNLDVEYHWCVSYHFFKLYIYIFMLEYLMYLRIIFF